MLSATFHLQSAVRYAATQITSQHPVSQTGPFLKINYRPLK